MTSVTTGGAILAHLLSAEGMAVTTGVLDASFGDLAVALDDLGIRRIAPTTESAAVHMAAAWSHVTNRPGVAFVATAAGVAHAIPAMADAQQTGDRVLVISTSRRTGVTGPNRSGLMASLDNSAITASLVKWSARVPSIDRLPELFRAAMRALWQGRPGVVHLDIPTSILTGAASHTAAQARLGSRVSAAGADKDNSPRTGLAPSGAADTWRTAGNAAVIAEATGIVVRAKLPVLHLGRGVLHSGAESQVRKLVEVLDAGVTTTWGGRGIIPEDDLHVVPPTHPGVVDDLRNDADVVVVLGADLGESDWWGQPPHWNTAPDQTIIHIDIDGDVVGRNRPADIGIVGDIATVLDVMLFEVEALGPRETVARRHWLGDHRAAVRRGRLNLNEPLIDDHRTPIHPATAVVATRLAMPDDTTWVLDGAHTRRWGQFHIPALHPRTQFGVGPLEMTGGGLGLAMGAALAAPERQVCVVMGDGAFARQLGELPTSLQHDLPMVVVVLVDGYAGPVEVAAGAEFEEVGGPPSMIETEAGNLDHHGAGGAADASPAGPDGQDDTDGPGGRAASAGGPGADDDGRGEGGGQQPDTGVRRGGAPTEDWLQDSRPRVAIHSLRELSSGVQADPVRYDLVARALGAWGEFVDDPAQLMPALARAREADRTAVVHVSIDRVEHTWTPEAGMFRAQRGPGRSPGM